MNASIYSLSQFNDVAWTEISGLKASKHNRELPYVAYTFASRNIATRHKDYGVVERESIANEQNY